MSKKKQINFSQIQSALQPMDSPEYITKRMIHLARKHAEHTKCKKCGGDGEPRKVVALHEFGDPYIPSQVVLYCAKCKSNETFCQRSIQDAMRYAEYQKGEKYEIGKKPETNPDKIVEDAIMMAKEEDKRKEEEAKASKEDEKNLIKDDDNKFIADSV